MRDMEDHARSDKARRDEALKAAYDRGLDAEERRRAERAAGRTRLSARTVAGVIRWYMPRSC